MSYWAQEIRPKVVVKIGWIAAEIVLYSNSKMTIKDQIHDETARQSRWAFGIGLTIR